ncbi:hypothetical protein AWB76_02368 [Caballeronia temeraria]|uniref:N-acetyltransferase domain-containing protein n=1 Tax=Caballeronia temeraria TaxID=1777137 RepID=A0A158AGD4_9BURK|nr:hypothetical protein AWB76_02368 [Caballeronia temeraria]
MTPTEMFVVARREDPCSPDAAALLDELDATMALFYGARGRGRLFHEDIHSARSTFLIVRTMNGFPLACGALRRSDYRVAEVAHLYSRAAKSGIGAVLLSRLEADAAAMGYNQLLLRTHKANRRRVLRAQWFPSGQSPIQRLL